MHYIGSQFDVFMGKKLWKQVEKQNKNNLKQLNFNNISAKLKTVLNFERWFYIADRVQTRAKMPNS